MSNSSIKGYLEVGHNKQNEVVIIHSDINVDKEGVGHVVFSPDQARHLANLLLKHAATAEMNKRKKKEQTYGRSK